VKKSAFREKSSWFCGPGKKFKGLVGEASGWLIAFLMLLDLFFNIYAREVYLC